MENHEFRDLLKKLTSTVSVVTMMDNDRRHGLTLSSFMSISIDPPTMAISVNTRHSAHEYILNSKRFVINVLGEGQSAISDRFAWVKDEDRFSIGRWSLNQRDMPYLEDSLFWLDCDLVKTISVHTHSIFVGEVKDFETSNSTTTPLLYGQGRYLKHH